MILSTTEKRPLPCFFKIVGVKVVNAPENCMLHWSSKTTRATARGMSLVMWSAGCWSSPARKFQCTEYLHIYRQNFVPEAACRYCTRVTLLQPVIKQSPIKSMIPLFLVSLLVVLVDDTINMLMVSANKGCFFRDEASYP